MASNTYSGEYQVIANDFEHEAYEAERLALIADLAEKYPGEGRFTGRIKTGFNVLEWTYRVRTP